MNIANSFAKLISRLQPSDSDIVLQHIYTIKGRLNSAFKLRKVLIGGSFARKTFARSNSNVDLVAVIARRGVTWGGTYKGSGSILQHFRNELSSRLPNTDVGRDVHAVVVPLSQGPSIDVVPAVSDKMLNGWPRYFTPDGRDGWMATSPEVHNIYIGNANEWSLGKLRRVAQLMKYWGACGSTRFPLSSFHTEILLAPSNLCTGIKSCAACIIQVLRTLAERECRSLQDPLGIADLIPAVKTAGQREDATDSIRYARNHANDACVADYAADVNETSRQWNIVFNGSFSK